MHMAMISAMGMERNQSPFFLLETGCFAPESGFSGGFEASGEGGADASSEEAVSGNCGLEEDGTRKAVLDLTESYPMLKEWVRTLTVVDRHTAVIEDTITAEREVTITYALHTLSQPRPSGEGFTVIRQGKTMEVIPEPEQFISRTISDQYDVDLNADVPAAYHVTMPQQYHVYFETASKKAHHLRVVIKVH